MIIRIMALYCASLTLQRSGSKTMHEVVKTARYFEYWIHKGGEPD